MDRLRSTESKVVLLSGASRGIGHASVKRFSSAGWRALTCSRHAFPQDGSWEGGAAYHIQVVLSDLRTIKTAIEKIQAQLIALVGRLNALVNNAARSPKGHGWGRLGTLDTFLEIWQSVFNVNFFATIMLARGLISCLEKSQGSVVNVTSIAGRHVNPFSGSAYATSKAALAALIREMAADFGKRGIRVNAISPGEIDTSILSPGAEKIVEEQILIGRLGQPEEVAKVIYFLCTSPLSYVSDAIIHINGGQHV